MADEKFYTTDMIQFCLLATALGLPPSEQDPTLAFIDDAMTARFTAMSEEDKAIAMKFVTDSVFRHTVCAEIFGDAALGYSQAVIKATAEGEKE